MRNFINQQLFNFGFRFIVWSGFFKVMSFYGSDDAVDAIFLAKDKETLDEAVSSYV